MFEDQGNELCLVSSFEKSILKIPKVSGLLFLFVLVSGFWFLVFDLRHCIMSCVMFCFFYVLCLMF